MTEPFDLDAYCARIGYSGERTPTLATLQALHLAHPLAIPFENLNPLSGLPVRLDAAALQDKLVRQRRGGYCFEQNLLLQHALTAIGFEVTGLAARVVWLVPPGTVMPRTHMLLRVVVDGQAFIVDVGFGGATMTSPLRLVVGEAQATPHEPFRLVRRETPTSPADAATDEPLMMEARLGGEWRPLYYFTFEPQVQVDYELANFWVSRHPESRFVLNLVAARPARDRRYALLNNVLTVHELGGGTSRRTLASVAELEDVLTGIFGLELPPEMPRDTLERVMATPVSG